MEIEGVKMLLGSWWMEAAIKAQVEFLPIVNIDHQEELLLPVDGGHHDVPHDDPVPGAGSWQKDVNSSDSSD